MAPEARAKGTAILQLVKALRSMPDAARAALPPRQRGYLEDRILVKTGREARDRVAQTVPSSANHCSSRASARNSSSSSRGSGVPKRSTKARHTSSVD